MSKFLVIDEHPNRVFSSSVLKHNKRDAIFTIVPFGTQVLNSSKGYNINEEQVINLLHNLDEKWEKYVRFIKNESEMKEYSETEIVEKADKDEVLTKVETPEIELPKLEDEIENAKLAAEKALAEALKIADEEKARIETEKEQEVVPEVKVVPEVEVVVTEGANKFEEVSLLDTDVSVMNEDQKYEYLQALKEHAKEIGLKLSPALKNIETIKTRISEFKKANDEAPY